MEGDLFLKGIDLNGRSLVLRPSFFENSFVKEVEEMFGGVGVYGLIRLIQYIHDKDDCTADNLITFLIDECKLLPALAWDLCYKMDVNKLMIRDVDNSVFHINYSTVGYKPLFSIERKKESVSC